MDIHPVFVGLVAGMVAFALSCPFVLWIALPAHEGGSLHRRLFGNTSRRRALVVIASCALASALFAALVAYNIQFDYIQKIG